MTKEEQIHYITHIKKGKGPLKSLPSSESSCTNGDERSAVSRKPLIFVILSASLFGLSPPLAKLLVKDITPVALAGLLYLGSFVGLSIYRLGRKASVLVHEKSAPLEKKDIPWLTGAILSGGILGPICLMAGLRSISGFSASLLLNLEGLATALVAMTIFKEHTGKRFWIALTLMTLAGLFLCWNPDLDRFTLRGPLLVTSAMVCWGLDNNLTCRISDKDPVQITQIKGLFAGSTSLLLAILLGLNIPVDRSLVLALLLGSLSYGLSLVLFIKALKGLGSSRTGAFFSLAPFVGALFSLVDVSGCGANDHRGLSHLDGTSFAPPFSSPSNARPHAQP